MHTLVALTTIFLACTACAYTYLREPYSIPQKWLVGLGAAICLALGVGATSVFSQSQLTITLILGMVVVWIVRSATAIRPHLAMSTATWMIGVVIVGLMATSTNLTLALGVLVVAGFVNAFVGIVQAKFRHWNPDKKHNYAVGFCGNENFLGNFLTGVIFLTLWLAAESSLWWLVGLPMVGYCLYLTRCKTAFFGLIAGLTTYLMLLDVFVGLVWGIVGCVGFWFGVVRLKPRFGANRTFKERLNYWRVGLWQIKRAPLLGVGFNCIQAEIPYIQREIDIKTKGEFLKFENYACPWPQKLHNDLIQSLVDNGLIGTGLLYGIVGVILWQAFPTLDLTSAWLFSGVVGMLVCGMGFHTLHILPSNLVWWTLLLSLGTTAGTTTTISPTATLVGLGVFTFLFIETLTKDLFVSWHEAKFFRTKGHYNPEAAFELRPTNSFLHTHLAVAAFQHGKLGPVFYHTRAALENFDGQQQLCHLYTNLGKACMMGGSFVLARDCAIQAITLLPQNEEARTQLNQCDKIMENVNGPKSERLPKTKAA